MVNENTNNKEIIRLPVNLIEGSKKKPSILIICPEKYLAIKLKHGLVKAKFNSNYYRTLRDLDKQANKKDCKILCNGTSKHCFCAGFCFNMARGEAVYYKNPKTNELEVKSTFGCENWNEYATQEEQEAKLTRSKLK